MFDIQKNAFEEHIILHQSAVSKISVEVRKMFVPYQPNCQEICPASILGVYKEEYRHGTGEIHKDDAFKIVTQKVGYWVDNSGGESDNVIIPVRKVPVQIALCETACPSTECMLGKVHKVWGYSFGCVYPDKPCNNPPTYLSFIFKMLPNACWLWYTTWVTHLKKCSVSSDQFRMKCEIDSQVCFVTVVNILRIIAWCLSCLGSGQQGHRVPNDCSV